jgi:hypothetical protein
MWKNVCDKRCTMKGRQLQMQQCVVVENWPKQKKIIKDIEEWRACATCERGSFCA